MHILMTATSLFIVKYCDLALSLQKIARRIPAAGFYARLMKNNS
jgi:hypothetical protein